MKKNTMLIGLLAMLSSVAWAQADKSKRPSPPDSVTVTTHDGVTIAIHYSRPSLKGREVGVEVAPAGKVWRTGANEATTFEVNKDVTVEGKRLSAGKYSIHSIPGDAQTVIIFNKVWKKWGTQYDEKEDALRVTVGNATRATVQELFKIEAAPSGVVTATWGRYAISFTVKAF